MVMEKNQIDLEAEIAQVLSEIAVFREECLPAMLDESLERPHEEGAARSASDSLSAWQAATCRLADMLRSPGAAIHREIFGELVNDATTSWRSQSGRIRWRIELFVPFDGALLYWYPASKEERERLSDCIEWPTEHRLEIEAHLLGLYAGRVDGDIREVECALWNALCMVLPWIADVDPAFAKLALDKENWRNLALTNHALTHEQRQERLRLIDGYFGRVLNNALLHVLGALANNHFFEIRGYLNHPNVRGSYTYHMPYYLFTVLYEKAAGLRLLEHRSSF